MDVPGILAILSSLVGIPLIVFGFLYINKRNRRSIDLARLKNGALKL